MYCLWWSLVDLPDNRNNKSVQVLQFSSLLSVALQLLSQTVILSQPKKQQETQDMIFKQYVGQQTTAEASTSK